MHIRNPRPSDFCSPIGLELFSDVQSTSVQNTNRPVDTRGAARLFPNVKEEDKTFSFFFFCIALSNDFSVTGPQQLVAAHAAARSACCSTRPDSIVLHVSTRLFRVPPGVQHHSQHLDPVAHRRSRRR